LDEHVKERLDRLERTLASLQDELAEIRRLAGAPSVATPAVAPPRPPPPLPPLVLPPKQVPKAAPRRPRVRPADLLGAQSLAWSGGAVTLLGVVLLFVLAVNRGWIGPWERCGIGFAVSSLAFAGGLWLRQRFGPTYSALAAVGAGIGGAYASLLAAAALYDLMPGWFALVVAAAIAAVGVVTSIVWSSQIVAGLGLIGAMLVPVAVVFDGGLTVLGVSFVAVTFAATGVVAVWRRWNTLLIVGVLASAPQIAVLVADGSAATAKLAVLAGIFGLLYLAAAIAEQLSGEAALQSLPAGLAVCAAVVAGLSAGRLFDGVDEGIALSVIAAVYGLLAVAFFPRRGSRDLSSLLWAIGLAVGAVALGDLLSGNALAIGWAAEAAVLAWLAVRTREVRFQLAAIAYLVLATVHALAIDAPLGHLFVSHHPASGALSVAAAALAAAIVGLYTRLPRDDEPAAGVFRHLEPLFAELRQNQAGLRETFFWTAAVLATWAASLGLLGLFAFAGGHSFRAFDWGHVAVSVFWAVIAAVLLALAARRRSLHLSIAGNVMLGAALAKVFLHDLRYLNGSTPGYAALAVGAVVLLGGYVHGRERPERSLSPTSVATVLSSAILLTTAATDLLGGKLEGAALLVIGAAYGALAATILRPKRDFSTLLWATGLVIVLSGWPELLSGTPLVIAWAATGAALSWLGHRLGEDRLNLGAAASVAVALLHTLVVEAPPRDLFSAGPHPGDGVVALAAVALATGVLAFYERLMPEGKRPKKAWPWLFYELDRLTRRSAVWVAGIAAVDAVSLSILQLFQWAGTGSVHLEFQHGHTAVSAFWGVLGLAALYLGLKRRAARMRLAGFAIFGVSLAKIFLYDLSELSSITRAFSFLAVGAVLLFGGFLYQRLSAELDERNAAPS
jgi:uncharacterized membrane protein